jgi:hypothetical protein
MATKDGEEGRSGLDELREAVAALERRVSRVETLLREGPRAATAVGPGEGAAAPARTVEAGEAGGGAEAAGRSHLHLTRLALACFVLAVALVLRVSTEKGWISPGLGIALGLAYSAALLALPAVLRSLRAWDHGLVLQLLGLLLGPLVVLETTLRFEALEARWAALALGAIGLLGAVVGLRQTSRALAAVALLVPIVFASALGASTAGLLQRAAVVAGAAALGQLLGRARPAFRFIVPLTAVPAAIVLGGGVLLTAHRPGLGEIWAAPLLAFAAALFAAVAAGALARSTTGGFDRAAPTLASLWFYGLAAFCAPDLAVPAAAVAGGCLVLLSALLARSAAARTDPRLPSLFVAGVLACAASLPFEDRTGFSLALCALLAGATAPLLHREGGGALLLLAPLAGVVASLVALVPVGPWPGPARPLSGLVLLLAAEAGSGAALLALSSLVGRIPPPRAARHLSPVLLAAGLVLLFDTLSRLARHLLGSSPVFAIAQTVLLAASSTLVVGVGRARGHRPLATLGLLGVCLLAAKSLLWDLAVLEGAFLVASVTTLGLAAAATSLLLRALPPHRDGR